MNKKKITNNKIFKASPYILLASVVLGYYHFTNLEQYWIADLSLAHLFIYSFGHLEQIFTSNLINVILWNFPILFLIYLLGDTVYHLFKRQTAYIFTRTDKRSIWYIKQSIKLLVDISLFYFVYFSGNLIIGIINQVPFTKKTDIIVILIVLTSHIIGSYLILLLINFLSFYIKIAHAYLAVLFILFFTIMLSGLIFEHLPNYLSIIKWFPSAQFITSWHDSSILNLFQEDVFIEPIEEFQLSFTYGYYLIVYLTILIMSIRKINKIDII